MYYTVVKVASEPSLKVPMQHCQDVGYFRGNTLFLYQYILSKFGIQYNSRWAIVMAIGYGESLLEGRLNNQAA